MTPQPGEGFTWTRERWGRGLRSEALTPIASHVFTTRDLHLAPFATPGRDGWDDLATTVGASPEGLVRVRQVHGATIFEADRARDRDPADVDADALVSADPGHALSVRAADCVPLLLADSRTGLVAAVHAGWRGTAAGIAAATVRALAARGARPADLVAAVGPSIGVCCYEVGADLTAVFEQAGHSAAALGRWFIGSAGKPRLDLWTASRDQLIEVGLSASNVHVAGLCTACHPTLFHSFRKEGQRAGRLAAVIRASRAPAIHPSPDSPAGLPRG